MKLSPAFFDELRSRVSLSQVAGRKLLWDKKKSQPNKGDMWAPCPFHHEKTASFHVDDRKGFYYCFGCHEKGDALAFVQKTENVSFMEAVEILAREAGMQMPDRDPQEARKAEKRATLTDLMEDAARFFALQLRSGAGRAARDYLDGRALNEAARERWQIGFAPDAWQGLWDHLTGKGARAQDILACGLAKPSNKGGNPYDTFRNRIMFPIRDARGRCIAFGGRAMDPNDNAKYLNSPETQIFDKGRSLYNHGPAREAVGKGAPLIVAEGYMDVIALSEAGFTGAVAPLGTAVTEHQIDLLWRISPEPIVALDGDTAGLRAAMKVIDLALPKLGSGRSVRFALLPEGKDPDDLIRAGGRGAMQEVLDAAQPLVELLWRRETEGRAFDSPERRAALDHALKEHVARIPDDSLRYHYDQALRDKKRDLFRPSRPAFRRVPGKAWPAPRVPLAGTRASRLVAEQGAEEALREAVILASLACTPEAAAEFEADLERMECAAPNHARLRDLILMHAHEGRAAVAAAIAAEIGPDALDEMLRADHVALCPPVRRPGDVELAQMTVAEEMAKLRSARALRREIAEAAEEITGAEDEALTWRLGQAAQAEAIAKRSQQEDRAEFDIAENGVAMNKDERSAARKLFDSIRFEKRRR